MNLETWHVWIIVAIILFIVEIFTPALSASCLALSSIRRIKDLLNSGEKG